MKRVTVATLALCLACFTTGPSLAGRQAATRRTVVLSYAKPVLGVSVATPIPTRDIAAYCNARDPLVPTGDQGCMVFDVKKGERRVQLEVKDATTLPVLALVFDSSGTLVREVCGKDHKPFPVRGTEIEIWVMVGNCTANYMPSTPTTGEVVATFWR